MRTISLLLFSILCLSAPHDQPTSSSHGIQRSAAQIGIAASLSIFASSCTSSEAAVAVQTGTQYANRGDVASGRVIREEKDELDLDTSPCRGDRVVRFHQPYEKSVIRKARCGDQEYDRTQVEQK